MMEVARLLGLIDTGSASSEEVTLHRILTPLVKLYTAKQVDYQSILCSNKYNVQCIEHIIFH